MRDAGGRVLVERRPPSGIWGGLWSFPEASADLDLESAAATAASARRLRPRPGRIRALAPVEHGFTHFRLRATPVVVSVEPLPDRVADAESVRWIDSEVAAGGRGDGDADGAAAAGVGLAAAVGAVLSRLDEEERGSR